MSALFHSQQKKTVLSEAMEKCRSALGIVFIFSFVCNVLSLITSVYALQVLDRVLGSGSYQTLSMLSLIMGSVYLALHLIQVARSFSLIKVGEWLDNKISPSLLRHAVQASSIKPSMGASQSIREFGTVRSFLTSSGINSLFDAPWALIYIAVAFMIHPYMGWITVAGAVLMLAMGILNAYAINTTLADSSAANLRSLYLADIANRNAETIQAMGMMGNIEQRWHKDNKEALRLQSIASYRNGLISNVTRFFRMLLQMSVTAIGAYVVLSSGGRDMTGGTMIAASIIIGKALAPFDQAIEVWKQVTSARKSYQKIKGTLEQNSFERLGMSIKNPAGVLSAENVFFAHPAAPGTAQRYALKGIGFSLPSGKSLAIVGSSAAGKSTLARILAGVWKPTIGAVRMDGADVFEWNREDFGRHMGYLSQNVELFNGNVKENIARMSNDVDEEKVLEAAKLAGAHEMIASLPKGYETDIGMGGSSLSGGQRQRVGLARAFYDLPKIIVLDEPNSNLDDAGEQALIQGMMEATRRGTTVVIISHRPAVLSFVDMLMFMQDGSVGLYGPKEEVLKKLAEARQHAKQ